MKRLYLVAAFLSIACGVVTPTATPVIRSPQPARPTSTLTDVPTSTLEVITPTLLAPTQAVYGSIARAHLEAITGKSGARLAGTASETQAAQYIADVFNGLGYAAETQPFSRIGWVGEAEVETMVHSANVIAVKVGDSEKTIVVGAHYDSSEEGLGADDNASGVAVMLELAELLKDKPTPYTIHFVAFGAEEVGLLGSVSYVAQLSREQLKNTIAMVNLDSVTAGDIAYVYSMEGDKAILRDWALAWADQNGFDLQTIRNVDLNDEAGYATADYSAFQRAGIPFAYFEATNWTLGDKDGYTQVDPQYGEEGGIIHTEFDRLEYLDKTFPGRVNQHLEGFTSIVAAILTQFEIQ